MIDNSAIVAVLLKQCLDKIKKNMLLEINIS